MLSSPQAGEAARETVRAAEEAHRQGRTAGKDRVGFNGADWNLRRLAQVDATLLMSYDPGAYLSWMPEVDADMPTMPRTIRRAADQ